MDFALLDKPVFYYQFDYELFRQGHLGEGYFDYELDGFGPVCKERQKIICELDQLLSNKKENDRYQVRRAEFFTLKDRNNCKRTYEAIKDIK